jgi:hypothetical protein
MKAAFQTYLSNIASDYKSGKSTEHTYRSTLVEKVQRPRDFHYMRIFGFS